MRVTALREPADPMLARALADFERQFSYPLGAGRTFRISHGEDYARFFRAIGQGTCFIAQQGDRVVGTLGVAIRPLLLPDGSRRQSAYIGDLKIDPAARGTMVLLRLAQAADAWARPDVSAAYGVVMDGTPASPTTYTGRVGIEAFAQVGKVCVLRIPGDAGAAGGRSIAASIEAGEECFARLSRGRYAGVGGTAALRSEMDPQWLVHGGGNACGRLEDTRRAKRLIENDGMEMASAHLACFAWKTPVEGADVIRTARRLAGSRGMPAIFVCIPRQDLEAITTALGPIEKIIAPATVYGAGVQNGPAWNINSSEI